MSSCLRPAFSMMPAATAVPSTLVRPTAALARVSDATPAWQGSGGRREESRGVSLWVHEGGAQAPDPRRSTARRPGREWVQDGCIDALGSHLLNGSQTGRSTILERAGDGIGRQGQTRAAQAMDAVVLTWRNTEVEK